MQLANVVGDDLTDPKYAPVWAEIDRLGLPVADPVRGGEAFERLVDACLA